MSPPFSHLRRAAGLAALCAVLASGLASRARAADQAPPLTPEQVKSLEQAIRLWAYSPADSDNAKPDYTMTSEGDHYRITQASGWGLRGSIVSHGTTSASARPLPGGIWAFDDISSTPIEVTSSSPRTGTTIFRQERSGQSGHAVIDPSFATQSTIDMRAESTKGSVETAKLNLVYGSGVATSHQVWQPAGPGRVDLTSRGDTNDITFSVPGTRPGMRMDMAVREATTTLTMRALSLGRAADMMATLRRDSSGEDATPPATRALPDPGSTPGESDPVPGPKAAGADQATIDRKRRVAEDQARLRRFVQQARDLAASTESSLTLDDVAVSFSGHTMTARRFGIAEGVGAPGGKLDAHLRFAIDGFKSAEIPPAFADFVPSHLVIAPRLIGIPTDQIFTFLTRAFADTPPSSAENKEAAMGLLTHGPVALQFDEVAIDTGPAKLHAVGSVQVAGAKPSDVSASADVEARGLDDLLRQVGTNPLLRRALPVLILMKGLGEERDGVTHWHIAVQGGRILVNGNDLSGLRLH